MTPDDRLAAYERVVEAARKYLESLDDLHASQVMEVPGFDPNDVRRTLHDLSWALSAIPPHENKPTPNSTKGPNSGISQAGDGLDGDWRPDIRTLNWAREKLYHVLKPDVPEYADVMSRYMDYLMASVPDGYWRKVGERHCQEQQESKA